MTIRVQERLKVDRAKLISEVRRGKVTVLVLYGGQTINIRSNNNFSVIATCVLEAFTPDLDPSYSVT